MSHIPSRASDEVGSTARRPGTRSRELRSTIWAAASVLAWAVSALAVRRFLDADPPPSGALAWAAATLPPVVLLVAFALYGRFLREADELHRLIQLRALALGFGAGWLAVGCYPLFERLGAPSAAAEDYLLVLAFFYSLGLFLGCWQYR